MACMVRGERAITAALLPLWWRLANAGPGAGTWTKPPDDPEGDATVASIEGVAAGEVDEDALRDWIADRLG